VHVAVLGGGVIGVTTAWYLARAGHRVTLVERREGAGLETSFANAGLVTAGHAEAWAGPGVPLKVLRWLGHEDAPVLLRLRADPRLWGWCWRFLRNCTEAAWRTHSLRNLRLAAYSLSTLAALRDETGLTYEQGRGLLLLTRDPATLEHWQPVGELMRGQGVAVQVLDRAGCEAAEPALRHTREPLHGAIHFPDDESGDCYRFTSALAERCAAAGVALRFGTTVRRLEAGGGRIVAAHLERGGAAERLQAEHYVLATGSYSAALARQVGLRLPVVPIKGYSVTLPVSEPEAVPTMSLSDLERRFTLSRLGNRLRGAGTAEFAGYDTRLRPRRIQAVLRGVRALVPEGLAAGPSEPWCGLRPVTPDGPPILGPTPLANLTLNTGHGTLGWTMACGSARVVADLLSGHRPQIDLEGLTLERF
jgi:D-amino-acid dehydrogenase